jgi:hypothetical protein
MKPGMVSDEESEWAMLAGTKSYESGLLAV